MKKSRAILTTSLLVLFVSGCAPQIASNHTSNLPKTVKAPVAPSMSYFAVQKLWNDSAKPIQQLSGLSSIISAHFMNTKVSAFAPGHGFILISPKQQPPGSHYKNGLYVLNPSTGKIHLLLSLNSKTRRIDTVAANRNWVVYELSIAAGQSNHWVLKAYNWASKKATTIHVVPPGYTCPNGVMGLSLNSNTCTWSDFLQKNKSQHIVSQLHSYSLKQSKDRVLVHLDNTQTGKEKRGIIVDSSSGDKKVIYSVFDGKNPINTKPTGQLRELNLSSKKDTQLLKLYHSTNSIDFSNNKVVFQDNYQKPPNGPNNTAPYPIYLYTLGDNKVQQVSPGKDVYFPSLNQRFVAWNGEEDSPQLYDMKTDTYYVIPGIITTIVGHYVTWAMNNKIYWANLPQ